MGFRHQYKVERLGSVSTRHRRRRAQHCYDSGCLARHTKLSAETAVGSNGDSATGSPVRTSYEVLQPAFVSSCIVSCVTRKTTFVPMSSS